MKENDKNMKEIDDKVPKKWQESHKKKAEWK